MDLTQRYMLLDCKKKAERLFKKSIIRDPHCSSNYHLVSIFQSTDNDIKNSVKNIKKGNFSSANEARILVIFS